MCIAIYKPENEVFPSKKTLQRCFEANPDGAGYMLAHGDKVHIRKGFATFGAFWKDLRNIRDKVTDNPPFVLHFRISTQAGIRPDCTHPFPLSKNMADLRALRATADIGIAHNGVISLTSHGWNKTITYSDTMEFITDYASKLIRGRNWHEDRDLVEVIEGMAGSRLAIMDGGGKCVLLGSGWRKDGGVWYSNASYLPQPTKTTTTTGGSHWLSAYYQDIATKPTPTTTKSAKEYEEYFDEESGLYFFDDLTCPATEKGDATYCDYCAYREDCYVC